MPPFKSWLEDRHLVADVRAGNGVAFARVYDRHARELLSFCIQRLGSREDADDALQQTFMKAYRALREGPNTSEIALRPWLYAIARNECVSLLRSRQVQLASAEQPKNPDPPLASEVEDREEMRAVLGDISRLPENQRQALLLSGVDRLSGEEVAGSLGTEPERVKALVFRARTNLKKSREARELSCAEIRDQLMVLRGGSLRRRVLREHLLACDGCSEFRASVRRGKPAPADGSPLSSPARA